MIYKVYGDRLDGSRQYLATFHTPEGARAYVDAYLQRPNPYHGFSIDTTTG